MSDVSRPTTVRTLPAVPGLGALYARAAVPRPGRLLARVPGLGGRHGASGSPTLPDVTYRVAGVVADEEHLLAYQRLLREPADDRLPAGFVHVLAFPVAMAIMVRPDFPLPVAGMVHLANRVVEQRPITVDEELEVHAWAENLRPHRRGTQVDLVTEVSTRYGEGDATHVVWRGVSTYLAKTSATPYDVPGTRDALPASASDRSEADASAQEPVRFPTGQWALDGGTGRRYAAVSGDRNPIHLSGLTAKAFGFPRAIAHGMYTASRALAEVGPARGDAFEWTVEFAKPVLLPGRVAVSITPDDAAHPRCDARPFRYVAWNAKSGKEHFTGTVVPLLE